MRNPSWRHNLPTCHHCQWHILFLALLALVFEKKLVAMLYIEQLYKFIFYKDLKMQFLGLGLAYRSYSGNWRQRTAEILKDTYYRNFKKGLCALNKPYVHSIFTLLLIKFSKKQITEASSECQTQIWPWSTSWLWP